MDILRLLACVQDTDYHDRIKQYFQEIGCRITLPTEADKKVLGITKAEVVNHNIATLKIPLVFPKVKMGRKAAGR